MSLVFAFAGDKFPLKEKPTPVKQAFLERSPGNFDAVGYVEQQQQRFDWLMAEAAPLYAGSVLTIRVTPEDLAAIDNYECENCGGIGPKTFKVRIGLVKSAGVDFDFKALISKGAVRKAPDGGFTWTAAVESPTAAALRVHFADFALPGNAELYVYGMNGEAFGPYTGRGPGGEGDFWSHTVTGPVTYVQLRCFGPPSEGELQSMGFSITEAGYLGEKFRLPFFQQKEIVPEGIETMMDLCSENADCVEDASCYSGGAIDSAKYAVAHMEWIAGAWIYYCSGGLLADTDGATQIPYFLTANHCLSKAKDAKNLECFWQYWTASCGGACYDPVGVVPRTLGSDVVSANRSSDYSLLRLRETPPAGSVFLGWTTADAAYNDGLVLFRISYPHGSPQAYSEHEVDVNAGVCSSWPRGGWIYSRDTVGATEGGSSGSPVMNLSGQVVGQLSGACGTNVNEVCDNVNNATVDGAFAAYFSQVEQWLDPPTAGEVRMHVYSNELSTTTKAVFTTAFALVTVVDENGGPVAGAVVEGTFSGDIGGTASGTTNAGGVATLSIKQKVTVNTFNFCVDAVTHPSHTYNPGANIETCDTL